MLIAQLTSSLSLVILNLIVHSTDDQLTAHLEFSIIIVTLKGSQVSKICYIYKTVIICVLSLNNMLPIIAL